MSEKYQYLKSGQWKACQTGTTPIINKKRVHKMSTCLERLIIIVVIILTGILILSPYVI